MRDLLTTAFENCGANENSQANGLNVFFQDAKDNGTTAMGEGVKAFFN